MKITVLHNQSLLDIAIQEYGTIEAVFELALANGLGIIDELIVGSKLTTPVVLIDNKDIIVYYKENTIIPVSSSNEVYDVPVIGIGKMIIETNFIVG